MNMLHKIRQGKTLNSEKGAAAVEFALLLPVLAALVFGMIDFGIMLWQQEVLVNATREGARQGILFGSGNGVSDIQGVVTQYVNDGGLNAAGLNVAVTGVGTGVGNPLVVTSTLPFQFIVADKLIPGLTTNQLTAVVTMMNEG